MLLNIAMASFMMLLTVGIHSCAMVFAMRVIRRHEGFWRPASEWRRIWRVGAGVLLMFLASVIETSVWATAYLALGAIQGFEPALYFSTVTFTTLGYGEIVLNEQWRLLASFEAANGIIMFGWSTAIVIALVQHLYFKGAPERRHREAGE